MVHSPLETVPLVQPGFDSVTRERAPGPRIRMVPSARISAATVGSSNASRGGTSRRAVLATVLIVGLLSFDTCKADHWSF